MCEGLGRKRADHVEGCAGGDGCALPSDIFDAFSWQADGDDGQEAEDFFDKGGDVGDFFFREAFFPGVTVGVDFSDFIVGLLLDLLPVGRREVGDAHNEVSRDGVEAGGDHC